MGSGQVTRPTDGGFFMQWEGGETWRLTGALGSGATVLCSQYSALCYFMNFVLLLNICSKARLKAHVPMKMKIMRWGAPVRLTPFLGSTSHETCVCVCVLKLYTGIYFSKGHKMEPNWKNMSQLWVLRIQTHDVFLANYNEIPRMAEGHSH